MSIKSGFSRLGRKYRMRKMKKRFSCLQKGFLRLGQVSFLGLIGFYSQAQWKVGIVSGINKNHLQTNTVFATSQVRYEDEWGKEFGLTVQRSISDWFSVGTGLILVEKSYQRSRTGYFQEEYQLFKNSYIQIPLAGTFRFGGEKLKGFLRLGANTDIWIYKRTKGNLYNVGDMFPSETTYPKGLLSDEGGFTQFNLKESFHPTTDRLLQLGYQMGVGAQYQVTKQIALELEFSEQQQQSMVKNYMRDVVPRRNHTQHIRLGITWNLQNKNPKNEK